MLLSMATFAGAVSFSDLAADHWAYNNIQTLVNEGTINGYEDGTFKPSKSVTRAEFVKMLGKWNQKYSGTYSDLSEKHWAYEYIMWSGLDATGSMIYPDAEIKRGEVINLIWKRNGSPKHDLAPKAISSQGTNPDATSWAYTIGLMKGDDGLNLRLDSSLTRAEAATLIVRSREMVAKNEKNNFIDVVSSDVLKATYESLDLLGDAYNENKVLTYGEIARMAIVFGADGSAINFVGNDLLDNNGKLGEFFEHKYTNEMFILSKNVWGSEYYTPEMIDKPATVQDAVSAIMFGFTRRGTAPMDVGNKNGYYPDCTNAESTALENMYLTYASKNGIKLYAGNALGASEQITAKKYAALMVQFNEVIGLTVGYTNGTKANAKMNTYLSSAPANYRDFKATISGAPTALYNLKKDGVLAKDSYNTVNKLAFVYNTYLSEVRNSIKNSAGYALDATFYPSISYKQDSKVTFVAKFTLKDKTEAAAEVSVDTLFAKLLKAPTGLSVKANSEFYVVFETYEPLMDIYLPLNGAYVKSVFVK